MLLLGISISTGVSAQKGPILPLDDSVFWAYQALVARGLMPPRNIADFPIKESVFAAAIEAGLSPNETAKGAQLKPFLSPLASRLFSTSVFKDNSFGIRLRPGVTIANQESNDFLRPELNPKNVAYSLLSFESWFTAGSFTAAWGWRHDRYYDRDPEGMDTAHRWAIRPENAYISYDGKYAQVMVGRVRRHFGPYDSPGLFLSDNARPMDHLSLTLGTDQLNVHTVLSELDSITGDGRFTGIAGDDSVRAGSERRYLAVHKFSYQVNEVWTAGITHSILYSGANSNLSFKYINPFHLAILSVDEKPKNEENNGLIGAFFIAQQPGMMVSGQLAVDDLDILNGREPASIAANISGYFANVLPHTDLSANATIVTGRTYNAEQPEGKYLYLNRGIATQYSDYAHFALALPVFLREGIHVTPKVDILLQGEGDIKSPFPGHEDSPAIFDGVTELTIRPSLSANALLPNRLDLSAGIGVNLRSNAAHVRDASETEVSGYFSVGYRFMWNGRLK